MLKVTCQTNIQEAKCSYAGQSFMMPAKMLSEEIQAEILKHAPVLGAVLVFIKVGYMFVHFLNNDNVECRLEIEL